MSLHPSHPWIAWSHLHAWPGSALGGRLRGMFFWMGHVPGPEVEGKAEGSRGTERDSGPRIRAAFWSLRSPRQREGLVCGCRMQRCVCVGGMGSSAAFGGAGCPGDGV